jgi:DNA-binding beta-propeller fold protein YncE
MHTWEIQYTFPNVTLATGLAYDPLRDRIWVSQHFGNNIFILDASDGNLVTTLTGIPAPSMVAYDPVCDRMWVTNFGSDVVTVHNAADGTFITSYSMSGKAPQALTYDWTHDWMWLSVQNPGVFTGPIKALNAATGSTVISPFGPFVNVHTISYDARHNMLWASHFGEWPMLTAVPVTSNTLAQYTTFLTPGSAGAGILYEGDYLWSANLFRKTISRYTDTSSSYPARRVRHNWQPDHEPVRRRHTARQHHVR